MKVFVSFPLQGLRCLISKHQLIIQIPNKSEQVPTKMKIQKRYFGDKGGQIDTIDNRLAARVPEYGLQLAGVLCDPPAVPKLFVLLFTARCDRHSGY